MPSPLSPAAAGERLGEGVARWFRGWPTRSLWLAARRAPIAAMNASRFFRLANRANSVLLFAVLAFAAVALLVAGGSELWSHLKGHRAGGGSGGGEGASAEEQL